MNNTDKLMLIYNLKLIEVILMCLLQLQNECIVKLSKNLNVQCKTLQYTHLYNSKNNFVK